MINRPKQILKEIFGYEAFRKGQNEIISSIVNKKNILAPKLTRLFRSTSFF